VDIVDFITELKLIMEVMPREKIEIFLNYGKYNTMIALGFHPNRG